MNKAICDLLLALCNHGDKALVGNCNIVGKVSISLRNLKMVPKRQLWEVLMDKKRKIRKDHNIEIHYNIPVCVMI